MNSLWNRGRVIPASLRPHNAVETNRPDGFRDEGPERSRSLTKSLDGALMGSQAASDLRIRRPGEPRA
jgi:hypothetical protein